MSLQSLVCIWSGACRGLLAKGCNYPRSGRIMDIPVQCLHIKAAARKVMSARHGGLRATRELGHTQEDFVTADGRVVVEHNMRWTETQSTVVPRPCSEQG